MRHLFSIVFLAAAIFVAAGARAEEKGYELSGTISTTAWTKYLGSNAGIFHDEPVLQTDLFIVLPADFYFDLWWSTGFDSDLSGDFGDEVDWTIGWSRNVKGLTVDVGISYFDLAELFSSDGLVGDVVQPYGSIAKSFAVSDRHTLVPYLKIEAATPIRVEVGRGLYTHIGLTHVWEVCSRLAFTHTLTLTHDTGAFGFERTVVSTYSAGAEIKLRGDIMLVPQIEVAAPTKSFTSGGARLGDGRGREIVGGLELRYNFHF